MEVLTTERRRSLRHQLILDLYCDGIEGIGVAQTRDINVHGLYFNTLTDIPKGARLKLRLPINAAREYLVIDAEVVYSQPKIGCAVEFIGLSEATEAALAEFIEEAKESRLQHWEMAA
ncbi:MAG TPA: PilZ domain-containing protein [Blastocatellia bacterium]|nr:PilZ domain-containing protein [Blastocatellia bacterium]